MTPGSAVHCRSGPRILAVLALLAAASLLAAPPASSHAVLVVSGPEDGAVVDEPPEVVTLEFSEVVDPQRVEVVGPDGNDLAAGDPTEDGGVIGQTIDQPTDTGEHTVTITFVAADGHDQEISVVFEYTGATADGADETAADDADEADEAAADAAADETDDADEIAAVDAEEATAGGALPVLLGVLGAAAVLVLLGVVAMRRLNRADAGEGSS